MTGRRQSYLALEAQAEVDGTPCPLDHCPAHDDPTARCAGEQTGSPLPAPHWQRIRASRAN